VSAQSIVRHFVLLAMFLVAGAASARAQAFEIVSDESLTLPAPATRPLRIALSTVTTSFVALQALDTATTLRGLGSGAVEANPLVGGLAKHPAAFVAVKGGLTAATVLSVKGMARKHPKAAMLTMLALNAGSAFVVRSNISITMSR
jgi:Domain of unknown function (DUF5658)